MKKILFYGDSITDAGRSRENDAFMGQGYPMLVAARLGFEEPNTYSFVNRGISGNRSIDALARIKADAINLAPDVMSILLGVNDIWHEFDFQNGVSVENYKIYYSMMIEQLRAALPDIKLMILEPFVLKAPATEERWDAFRAGVMQMAAAAKEVAEKYSIPFVPLLEKFDAAAETAPATLWLRDGVHPTPAGHELIAREWVNAYRSMRG